MSTIHETRICFQHEYIYQKSKPQTNRYQVTLIDSKMLTYPEIIFNKNTQQ